MKSSDRIKILLLLVVALMSIIAFSGAHVYSQQEDPRSRVDSRELKILLKPELFANKNDGFEKILVQAKETANELGIKLELKPKDAMFSAGFRKVIFFDTADNSLLNKGYALRKRVKYKKRKLQDDFELMLKYRNADPALSCNVDTSTSSLIESETKFEQDVVYKTDPNSKQSSIKYLYSKSTKAKNLQGDFKTVEDFTVIFPHLSKIGLPPNTTLAPVKGIEYLELKVEPVKRLYFGDGLSGEMDISIWYRNESDEPAIAEISFGYDITDYPAKMNSDSIVLSEKFYTLLNNKLNEKGYRHTGTTKTAFIYGRDE
jgi:hypothetical protein